MEARMCEHNQSVAAVKRFIWPSSTSFGSCHTYKSIQQSLSIRKPNNRHKSNAHTSRRFALETLLATGLMRLELPEAKVLEHFALSHFFLLHHPKEWRKVWRNFQWKWCKELFFLAVTRLGNHFAFLAARNGGGSREASGCCYWFAWQQLAISPEFPSFRPKGTRA